MSEVISVEVPAVGESISEVQIGQWLKADGDWVESGEDLVEIETEKASVQIPAPASGFLVDIRKANEEFAKVGDVIASIRPAEKPAGKGTPSTSGASPSSPATGSDRNAEQSTPQDAGNAAFVMPAAERLLEEHGLSASQVPATGPGGRLLKEDVLAFVRDRSVSPPTSPSPPQDAHRPRPRTRLRRTRLLAARPRQP